MSKESNKNLLELGQTALVIIDMQEAFRPLIQDFTETSARIAQVSYAAQILRMPIVITEQYAKGLGRTAGEIRAVFPPDLEVVDKTSFSCCGSEEFEERILISRVWQIILCGIEAHICVNQTAHDLIARGYQVHLLTDCISSRTLEDRRVGLAKMVQSGAFPTTTEMCMFELLRNSKHEQFKAIHKLIK